MTRRRQQPRELNPRDDPLDAGGVPATLRDDLVDIYAPKSGAQIAEEFANEEAELAALIAEAGGASGGGSVVLRQKNPLSRKFEWLGKFPGQEFLSMGGIAHIASKYGGGEYEMIIYGADNRILKRPQITIAASIQPKKENGAELSAVDRLAALMAEGFKNIQMQFQQVQRPPESREAMIREMIMMKELFGGGNRQDNSLDTLAKVLPIVREMVPREGDTNLLDVMMKLAQEFGPTIVDAAKRAQPALANAAAVPGSMVAQPGAVMPGAVAVSPEQLGANQMQFMLKAQLMRLCGEAEADSDPGPYAAIIVTKVKPDMLEKIVNDENYLDELAKIHAGVKLFPKWFAELREAIIEEMQPEPDEPPEPLGGAVHPEDDDDQAPI